jgi:hemerythrin-like metal-binding protein
VDDVASHPSAIAGIQAMNDQHGILVDTLNSLRHRLAQGEDRERVNEQIARLVEFTSMHFGCEESLLCRYEFPGVNEHRAAHRTLMIQMREAANRAEFVDPAELDRVLAYVRGQYVDHIQQLDREYSEWLNSKGVY